MVWLPLTTHHSPLTAHHSPLTPRRDMLEAQPQERAPATYLSCENHFREKCAMPDPDLTHLKLTTVGDVALVEITTKDIQGPRWPKS